MRSVIVGAVLVLAVAAGVVTIGVSAQQQRLMLGVLEDAPGLVGEPNYLSVRVLFFKDGPEWKAFPNHCPDVKCLKSSVSNYPRQVSWTIAFDGRILGEVTSNRPDAFVGYGFIGQERIAGSGPVPHVGKRSEENAGFLGGAVYRPLVANSQPNYQDPELWKPAQISNDTLMSLRQQFRKKFPKVLNCPKEGQTWRPWKYADGNIKLLKGYSSRNGWFVAALVLKEYRCDGPYDFNSDDPYAAQWFVIGPDKRVRFLGGDMWLVDAGDYDNDGKSELLFSVAGYNWGGYRLFYDELRKHVDFEFNYH